MGYSVARVLQAYWATIKLVRYSLLTIAAMLALGYAHPLFGPRRHAGPGLRHTGVFYPFFGTLLGWLGVALTGSDTASNVLFGGLQKITAEQLGLQSDLMARGQQLGRRDGQDDRRPIASWSPPPPPRWFGHEGDILRYVFFHSIALACLVGLLVTLQAYVGRSPSWLSVKEQCCNQ